MTGKFGMAKRDLIGKKTRIEFREYFVGSTLREIAQEFDAADVPLDSDYVSPEPGQRRSLVEQYYHAVDFSSWRDVRKVLRVYESVLLALEERIKSPTWGDTVEQLSRTFSVLTRCLERDGFKYADGRIAPVKHNPTLDDLSAAIESLDAHVLHQQIDRVRSSIDDDPELAIGTAKELLDPTVAKIWSWRSSRPLEDLAVMQQLLSHGGISAQSQGEPPLWVGKPAGSLDQLAA